MTEPNMTAQDILDAIEEMIEMGLIERVKDDNGEWRLFAVGSPDAVLVPGSSEVQ